MKKSKEIEIVRCPNCDCPLDLSYRMVGECCICMRCAEHFSVEWDAAEKDTKKRKKILTEW